MLPPGVNYVGRKTLTLGVPAAAFAVITRHLVAKSGILIPNWVLIALSVAALPLYAAFQINLRHFRNRREAAAMGKWPGNLDLLIEMQRIWEHGYPGDGLREVMVTHGPIVNVHAMWTDIFLTTCPEHIKIILATDFNNYVKGEVFRFAMNSVLGTGVFNSDGEMWKFHRNMTRPFFSRDRISHFEIFDRHAEDVIRLLKARGATGHAVDFQDLIGRFTLDSATDFLFGSCVNSLHASLPFPHNVFMPTPESESARAKVAMEFSAAFTESMLHIANRQRVGWVWPFIEMWKDRTVQPMKVVSAYIDPIIHDAIKKHELKASLSSGEKKAVDEVEEGATLLDELLTSTSDPKVLKDETLNILLAGKDTTQWTLTVIVYFLAIYPRVNARLREEILEHVGPSRRPTYDDIRDMKYLRAVINETMRLFPSVPFNVRESVHATTWPSPDPNEKPIYIPAGTQVPYSVFMMHRRTDLWGPDAEEFDPDRWFDERLKKYLLTNSFMFLPFNAGPRICLGQQFAYNEMSFILIRLLQNFSSVSLETDAFRPEARPPPDWATAEGRKGVDKFRPKMHLTMYSQDGMWVKMKESDST